MIIISGITFCNAFFGYLFRPLKYKEIITDKINDENAKPLPAKRTSLEPLSILSPSSLYLNQGKMEILVKSFKELYGNNLLIRPIFIAYILAGLLIALGLSIPFVFIPARVKELNITDENGASNFISYLGVGTIIGRLTFGLICNLFDLNCRLIIFIGLVFASAILTGISVHLKQYLSFALYSCLFGISSGGYISVTSVIIADLFGTKYMANAFGLLTFVEGVASIIGPLILGIFQIILIIVLLIINLK